MRDGLWPRRYLWAYRCLTSAALAAGTLALPGIAAARRRWLRGLGERLGGTPGIPHPPVWLHAASVGEIRLALPLARALQALGQAPCLSSTTVAGRDLARRELPGAPSFLAPLDHPVPLRRALARIRPKALVLLETELWPELLATARLRGIPVALVNGRISDRALRRYLRLRRFLGPLLAGLEAVLPRSEQDRSRLEALGCRPEALHEPGDLKSASLPRPAARPFRASGPRVLVAGSLDASELEAWPEVLRRTEGLRLSHVVAPRHLESLGALYKRLEAASIGFELWSRLRPRLPQDPARLVIVDTIGDLGRLYAEGDVCFVGGSLQSGRGGHNLLEPAAWGRPVLFGPGVADHRLAAEELLRTGGGLQIRDVEDLCRQIARLAEDAETLKAVGRRALEAAEAAYEGGQSALARAVEAISGLLR